MTGPSTVSKVGEATARLRADVRGSTREQKTSGAAGLSGVALVSLLNGFAETSAWLIFLILFPTVTAVTYFLLAISGGLSRWLGRRGAVLTIAAGSAIAVIGVLARLGLVIGAGAVIAIAGLAALHAGVSRSSTGHGLVLSGLGVIALVVSTAAIAAGGLWVTSFGVVCWVLGLIALKLGAPARLRRPAGGARWAETVGRRAVKLCLASAGLAIVGLVIVLVPSLRGAAGGGLAMPTLGITAIFVGLSLFGIGALHLSPDNTWSDGDRTGTLPEPGRVWLGVLAVGVVLGGIAVWATIRVVPNWSALVIVLVAALVSAGAFFVLKGEGLWVLLLVTALAVWVAADRDGTVVQVAEGESDGVILTFGDSFSSGQGASSYLAGTNTRASSGNDCRRSPEAYSFLLGPVLDRRVVNVACSGAETQHVDLVGQKADSQAESSTVPGRLSQIAEVERLLPDGAANVDLVLVGIGGNDAEFSTVVTACVLPADCSQQQKQFVAQAQLIEDDVARAYAALRAIEGLPADTPIVVVPYPNYVGDTECDRSFTTEELVFAAAFIGQVNDSIERAVAASDDPHLHVFPGVDDAFAGRRICEDEVDDAANFIQLVPKGGSPLQRLDPTSWHDGSMHPNEIGHRCLAVGLATWFDAEGLGPDVDVDALESIECPPIAPAADDRRDEVMGLVQAADDEPARFIDDGDGNTCVAAVQDMVDEGSDCFSGSAWAFAQLRITLGRLAVPFSMLILAGLFVALGVARGAPLFGERVERALEPFVPEPPTFVAPNAPERPAAG